MACFFVRSWTSSSFSILLYPPFLFADHNKLYMRFAAATSSFYPRFLCQIYPSETDKFGC